ncbi:MAG: patatin-like phospholipase family protein [Reichenbachiella sp.]
MLHNIVNSFPVRLMTVHLKSYQLLLASWVLLWMAVTSKFGNIIGIPYLFLDPEYLNYVGFWSFFILGTSLGFFVIAYNITSYILHAKKFPFLAQLSRPFAVFSINNATIPLIVLLNYTFEIIRFQFSYEDKDSTQVLWLVLALYLGMALVAGIIYLYFYWTNTNIMRYVSDRVNVGLKRFGLPRKRVLDQISDQKGLRDFTNNYLGLNLLLHHVHKIKKVQDKEALTKVFDQNHLNSTLLEITLFGLFLLMGYGVDVAVFKIPAAASVIILMSIVIMLVGAIGYWFRNWVLTVVIILTLFLNFLFTSEILYERHEAIGMNYGAERALYDDTHLTLTNPIDTIEKDRTQMLQILDKWRIKQEHEKPKAIFICVSGGGSRSALWTTSTMMALDKVLDGQLMNHTVMITGASGGMIGASFYRELHLRKKDSLIDKLSSSQYLKQISSDMLNPIIFNLVVNDLFVRKHSYTYEGITYYKDRGYAFEKQLNLNTGSIMDKKVMDYQHLEANAEIPIVLFGPTIMNDGRKLYVSTQHFSFMNQLEKNAYSTNTVDFMRMFHNQGSHNLKFTSALRMNASFPYVTPNITLPSEPYTKVMDAGVKDNFGVSDAIRFVYSFQDWFEKNTSGVVFIRIRDTKRSDRKYISASTTSILDKISNPISSVYNNLVNLQDISNENEIGYMHTWFDGTIYDVVLAYDAMEDYALLLKSEGAVEIDSTKVRRPSLNWHLNTKEKKSIIRNAYSPSHVLKMEELKGILSEGNSVSSN